MMTSSTTRHISADGTRTYALTVRAFAGMTANVHVVVRDGYAALIDTGSGSDASNADLDAGFAALRREWGETLTWRDLDRIVVTHGHIDHYGGLNFVRERSAAPIAMHVLDRPVVQAHRTTMEARADVTAAFLACAGVDDALILDISRSFRAIGTHMTDWDVATTLEDGDVLDGLFRVIHTPGHAAGQVCLVMDEVLFSADHVLARTNPRLTPAALEPHNGLAAYLHALERIEGLPGIRVAFAGHEAPMTDVAGRIAELRASHLGRLEQIRALCGLPRTLAQVAAALYPDMRHGSRLLLAVQAVATRMEYLLEQGAVLVQHQRSGGTVPEYVQRSVGGE